MSDTFTTAELLDAALSRFEAATHAGMQASWDETGLPADQRHEVQAEVAADIRHHAEAALRAALAHGLPIFDAERPGALVGAGEMIAAMVLERFRLRLSLSISVRRMVTAELALAGMREPGPTPTAPPPPGLRDVIAPR